MNSIILYIYSSSRIYVFLLLYYIYITIYSLQVRHICICILYIPTLTITLRNKCKRHRVQYIIQRTYNIILYARAWRVSSTRSGGVRRSAAALVEKIRHPCVALTSADRSRPGGAAAFVVRHDCAPTILPALRLSPILVHNTHHAVSRRRVHFVTPCHTAATRTRTPPGEAHEYYYYYY